jgi:hypothetical protein
MPPTIKLDETVTPIHVFVAMTKSRRSSRWQAKQQNNKKMAQRAPGVARDSFFLLFYLFYFND